jgi:GNAT superfamily N-acetyltransferase
LVKVRKVGNEQDRMKFIKLPWELYKDDPNWVAPLIFDVRKNLDPKKNPFFKHAEVDLFLAEKDGKLVGRIAAIKNDNHNKFHKDNAGFFGFFESIDDEEVSDLLLDTACQWCKEKGFDEILGPVNPSTNDECGLLVDGFDSSPVFLMTYNPKHYIAKIENFGFEKAKDLYAYDIPKEVINDEKVMNKLNRMSELIKKRYNVTTHFIDMKNLSSEVRKIEEIYNSAWETNWGFVPLTTEEFDYMAESLKMVVDPDLVMFAEVDGKPAGFTLSLPDFNQVLKKMNGRLLPFGLFTILLNKKKINNLRVIIMGVKPEFQKKGIDSVFYLETIKNGNKNGYRGAEISWVLEDNMPMRMTAEKLGAKIYKTYRIYRKALA